MSRCLVLSLLILAGRVSAQSCDTWRTQAGDSTIDLAPLSGFVEVCSQDAQLCSVLTAGYPPSVKTLGYFAPAAEWNAVRQRASLGFKHYLIAQLATSMTPERLPGFKNFLRSQQGNTPDHSDLPRFLAAEGRAPMGIFDETPNSISFGQIMAVRPTTGASAERITLVSTNSAVVVKNRVLSLYVFQDYRGDADADSAKAATLSWLRCLGAAN